MTQRYSHNELKLLLHKAFRGIGLVHAAEAAECVLWLETHGLDGIAELQKIWAWLEKRSSASAALAESTPSDCTVNAASASVLTAGASCFDLAIAHAHINEHAQVHVNNCYARLFAVAYCQRVLHRLAEACNTETLSAANPQVTQRGLHVLCYWHNDGHTHLVKAHAHDTYPSYLIMANDKRRNKQNLHIMCSQSADSLEAQLDALTEQINTSDHFNYRPEDFADHHQTTLLYGIEVEDAAYARLQTAAARMLVPASEGSRRGAGD